MRFKDKVAIVTGAAQGIGKATSKILVGEGAFLVAVDINPSALGSLVEEVEASGGDMAGMEVDVLESVEVGKLVEAVIKRFGKIDILVNAVGGSTIIENNAAAVDELTLEEWDKVMNFNLRGTFLCTNAIIKHMKKQGSGKIVNISSDAAHGVGDPGAAYVAAKAGVMAFTKKVSKEVGPFGINCNAIAPNMTLSERVGPRWEQRSDEDKQRRLEAIPLRRVSKPDDQAKVIAFLASSDADYVSGVTIDTNGGSY